MKPLVLVLFVFAALVLIAAGFFLGRFQARLTTDSGEGPRFRLKEEMFVLTSDGEPQGQLPAGTVIYLVPDPFGDRTGLFKAYFETDVNDMGPIEQIHDEPRHRYELEPSWLKSKRWLSRLSEEATAEESGSDQDP